MRLSGPGLIIFLSTLLVFAFSLNAIWAADHPTSLMELSYALWAKHSIVLGTAGQFNAQSVDDFVRNGSYYSALAPGASVLALPFVGLGFLLDGKFTLFGSAMLFSEFFVALCNSVAAYLVFKLGSMYFSEKTSAFVAFAYAFSTISWPFATYFFQSDISAMLDLLAVYLTIRMARGGSSGLAAAIPCGAALGAALTVDYVNAVLVPIVSLFLVYTFRRKLARLARGLAGLLVAAAVGVVLLALYNQAAFGDPFVTTEQAYRHGSSLLGSFSYPFFYGLYLDLLSPLRGIFVYCPVLILGAVGFRFMARRREMASEGVLLAACFVGILVPYSIWYDAVGGEAFGQRFLIPAIPFLLLPSGFVIEARVRGLAALAYILYGVGVLFNGIAGVTTAIPQVEAVSHFPFLTSVLPLFLNGALDTWWWRWAGPEWWALAVVIIATALMLPLVFARLLPLMGEGVPRETGGPPGRAGGMPAKSS
jgi:Dolichyl-phosphate-mannose-protein mannosyltransferase